MLYVNRLFCAIMISEVRFAVTLRYRATLRFRLWDIIMDASSLWDVMDTDLVPRDEIELLTRYLVDSLRNDGFRKIADKFVKEANIEEVGELDGSYMEYHEMWRERNGAGMDLWTFFCNERLKQKRLKENTYADDQVNDNDMIISPPKRQALSKLCTYIFEYFGKNRHLADIFVKMEETDAKQPHAGHSVDV
ncbi:unnamed protein product [Lactuca virosa]|uniref:LisH domain-containing protein n=1 Tax=Lactuca virosa TaxID=75947 RepID=A0AAU9NGX0_9ASTR|nr:unnamed protein product [Lactuca virosa]